MDQQQHQRDQGGDAEGDDTEDQQDGEHADERHVASLGTGPGQAAHRRGEYATEVRRLSAQADSGLRSTVVTVT
jgi:hypothetical protein